MAAYYNTMIANTLKTTFLGLLAAAALMASAAPLAVPPAPDLAAKSYILMDYLSGTTLAAREPDTRIEPASLTKLMTAYLSFKAIKEGKIKLEQEFTVSEKGWKTEGSRMFLDPKKPAKVSDLIRGMIVQSGNDACVTLSEAIAGSEEVFAQMMNTEAARLGMKSTHFMNSTGLPNAQHYTTARDLAVLSMAIIHDYPEFFPIYSMHEFRYNNITQPNRNLLLYRDPEVDGMKTGHTNSAGYCLIATKTHEGRRVLSVVLGATSEIIRANESAKLLGYGVQFFETPKLFSAKQVISTSRVFKGEAKEVAVGFDQDYYQTLAKGQTAKIKSETVIQEPLIAPLTAGQVVGKVKVSLDGQPLLELPLKALAAVPEAGFFGRTADRIRLWFH